MCITIGVTYNERLETIQMFISKGLVKQIHTLGFCAAVQKIKEASYKQVRKVF